MQGASLGDSGRFSSEFHSLDQNGLFDRLLFQVKKSLALFIFAKILEVGLVLKTHQVYLIRFVDTVLDIRILIRTNAQEKFAVVPRDDAVKGGAGWMHNKR